MVRTYKSRPGTRRYKAYDDEQLAAAIEAVRTGRLSLRKACKEYCIPLGTLSHKINKKYANAPGRPTALSDEEEASLVNHVKVVSEWGFPFDILDLRLLVKTYLSKVGKTVKQFKHNLPSREWAFNFLKRHKGHLTRRLCQNIKTARAKVSSESVKSYFDNLKGTLQNVDGSPIPPTHIFNYDETNLADDPGIKKCIFKRGVKYPERIRNSTKASTSVMFCGSAAGEMLPIYVVYKAEHIWSTWTEGTPTNTRYNRSKSGWFDSHHFSDTVLKLAKENNIIFTCLPANSTHLLQPLDVAFYGPLKRLWRSILDEWKSSAKKKSATLNKDDFPHLLKKLHCKLYPDGTETSANLVSGFQKCGIHPFDQSKALKDLPDAEQNVNMDTDLNVSEAVIDLLQTLRGVDEVPKQRRKKVTVEPGKSISSEDIQSTSAGTGSNMSGNTHSIMDTSDDSDTDISLSEQDVVCSDSDYSDAGETEPGESELEGEDFDQDERTAMKDTEPMNGMFYIVEFCGKKTRKHYVGEFVQSDNGDYEMKFLRRSQKAPFTFHWPDKPDIGYVEKVQLKKRLSPPTQLRRNRFEFSGKELRCYTESLQ
ncbi:uncharacterized protein LOC135481430 [Liolophura sinensis]|uniref:uncharacterized protein LOC135481430 n=1 Tax=Liolophura sinensis TaxID=3198878 RepID=UPI0031597AA6